MRTTPRRRSGSVLVEFALLLPVWIAVILAIAEFGWMFFRWTALDAAAADGCRAGSLVDPGEEDEYIARVEEVARTHMLELARALGGDECDTCVVDAHTVGEPPTRSLVCEVSREFTPAVGLYLDTRTLHSHQVARLEWQYAVSPR